MHTIENLTNFISYDNSKNIIAAIVLFYDITHQKQMEHQLKENETYLRNINKTKDKFFSIITHDLRTPFNSILGFSSLIEKNIEIEDYNIVKQYSKVIQKSAQGTIDLLTNLIEWSKTQSDRIELHPEIQELKILISNVIELLQFSAIQKNIDISFIKSVSVITSIDKAMFNTIIRNIVSNAIKFTHTGGKISVCLEKKNNKCYISISDNGIGIKKDNLDKLFKIEESISTLGTENESGSGLGLILCKEFINIHGGEISVESIYGKGSTFTIILPIKKTI